MRFGFALILKHVTIHSYALVFFQNFFDLFTSFFYLNYNQLGKGNMVNFNNLFATGFVPLSGKMSWINILAYL